MSPSILTAHLPIYKHNYENIKIENGAAHYQIATSQKIRTFVSTTNQRETFVFKCATI